MSNPPSMYVREYVCHVHAVGHGRPRENGNDNVWKLVLSELYLSYLCGHISSSFPIDKRLCLCIYIYSVHVAMWWLPGMYGRDRGSAAHVSPYAKKASSVGSCLRVECARGGYSPSPPSSAARCRGASEGGPRRSGHRPLRYTMEDAFTAADAREPLRVRE